MAVKLMIDSASDISMEEANKKDIILMPITITFGETEYQDGVDLLPREFYEKLMKLINSSGISVRQFCKEMHYAKDNVLRYKKGVEPSIRTLFEIAEYFECSIDDLLTREKNDG